MRKQGSILLMIAVVSMATTLIAQTGRSEISLDYGANFSKESDGNQVAQKPTTSGGFLASYRYTLPRYGGVELSYGFTRNNQNYTVADPFTGFQSLQSIQTNIHQATGAFVLSPHKTVRLTPFVLAGGGVLVFSPTNAASNSGIGASTQSKGTFLYGGGVDYQLFHRVAARLQYRGYLYKAPDFSVPGLTTGVWAHMAQPSAGLVFKF
jgi:outer membrane immunogenic protein